MPALEGGNAKRDKQPPPRKRIKQRSERAGTSLWQMHGGPGGCRGWDTVSVSTDARNENGGSIRVITRYRRCRRCERNYAHVTVLKRGPQGWTESGSSFQAASDGG